MTRSNTTSKDRALVVSSVEELEKQNLNPAELSRRPRTDAILMCSCEHFDVVDIKNPFMKNAGSTTGAVDREKAARQWQNLREAIEKTGTGVAVIEGQKGLEDMVFSANQALVGLEPGAGPYIVPAHMKHESREREVPHYVSWFKSQGYRVKELKPGTGDICFEGHGDAIWHPDKMLLWGGHGFRTTISAYQSLISLVNCPVLTLELVDETFYHLDTAFCPLDENTILYYPAAFSDKSRGLIERVFKHSIEVSREDAFNFACNALAIGNHVFLQTGSSSTVSALKSRGFEPVEVDTSEFMKSGGSAFCMTLDIYGDKEKH